MKMRLTLVVAAACLTLTMPARAEEPISFKGKTITMIIPTTAGANTDLSARLFA
jgi:tripartite-type tricarboxylate transporter receptor subunit TctC